MRLSLVLLILSVSFFSSAQTSSPINVKEVTRIEKTLSADDMMGRQVFTPGIEKAAVFIRNEFEAAGLRPLPGAKGYDQVFTMVNPITTQSSAVFDGVSVEENNIVAFTADTALSVTAESHYKKIIVKPTDDFRAIVFKYYDADENVLVLVDSSFKKRFSRLVSMHMPQFKGSANRIFVLSRNDPKEYSIQVRQDVKDQKLTNLVGIIPGTKKPEEYVIFSAHYDHLGMVKSGGGTDSVYNGANDDASGTTAVITLARYFKALHDNQRTLVFVAFTAEEIGEFGSAYFSKMMDPEKVVAMFNIEMVGTESKWGRNSAYITGFEKTDMGEILQKNLLKTNFKFYPDPYPDQMLFLRSDNASLAKKGVPAHTISTSKMDSEKYYHQLGDEMSTLDMNNMTEIIRSIALSAGSIISGQDTPQRVKPE